MASTASLMKLSKHNYRGRSIKTSSCIQSGNVRTLKIVLSHSPYLSPLFVFIVWLFFIIDSVSSPSVRRVAVKLLGQIDV
jgi:hypothetical protein